MPEASNKFTYYAIYAILSNVSENVINYEEEMLWNK